jgi:hypothetical protein
MTAETCPVVPELFGVELAPCGDPVIYTARFECENSCEREPLRLCAFHGRMLHDGDPAAACIVCDGRLLPAKVERIEAVSGD